MRKLIYILSFIYLTTILGCSDSKYADKEIERTAYEITQKLDSSSLEIFKEWDFVTRGGDIWYKISWDSTLYDCHFWSDSDRIEIMTMNPESFKKDFPYDYKIDTSLYYRVNFKKINENSISISTVDTIGQTHILTESIPLKSVFREADPFSYFGKLSKFKHDLGIISSSYRPDLGEFIELNLSNQHILTYISDNPKFNPRFKAVWQGMFNTGKTINKNWNFRKLKEPIDGG
jgi:hypothetical protein